jgi:hypothetical protein
LLCQDKHGNHQQQGSRMAGKTLKHGRVSSGKSGTKVTRL